MPSVTGDATIVGVDVRTALHRTGEHKDSIDRIYAPTLERNLSFLGIVEDGCETDV
jgi:hypothetical protein